MFNFIHQFDRQTIARGAEYYKQGRVTDLDYSQNNSTNTKCFIIEAKVSDTQVYETRICIELPDHPDDNIKLLISTCDCPQEAPCQHSVAMLYKFKYDMLPNLTQSSELFSSTEENDADIRFHNWLNRLSRQMELEEFETFTQTQDTSIVAYLLDSSTMKLNFYRVKHKKTGGLGKASELTSLQYINSQASYIRIFDRQIQPLVRKSLQNNAFRSDRLFQGPVGTKLLEALLQSDRLFLDKLDDNQRLQAGPALPLQIKWQEWGNGSLEPQFWLDSELTACILLPTRVATYIDPLSLQCGRIEHDLPDTLYEFLLECPNVPADQKNDFSHMLHDSSRQALDKPSLTSPQSNSSQSSLELPVTIEDKFIEHIDQPRLIIASTTQNNNDQLEAYLEFDYGGYILPASLQTNRESITQPNQHITIIRQPDVEKAYLNQLNTYELQTKNSANTDNYRLVMPGELAVQLSHWQHFLNEGKPLLEQQNWLIQYEDNFAFNVHQANNFEGMITEDESGWFDVSLNLQLEGRSIALLPLIQQWLSQGGDTNRELPLLTQLDNGEWLSVPHEVIRPVANTLIELYDNESPHNNESIKLSPYDAPRLEELEDTLSDNRQFEWSGSKTVRELAQQLKNCQGIQTIEPPLGLQATLRHYQKTGFNWLCFLYGYQFGGILADDMGLGKTLQVLTFLLYLKQTKHVNKPSLVIVPTSLLGNWHREAAQFTPDLKVGKWYGLERHDLAAFHQNCDMIVTTYGIIFRDSQLFQAFSFESVILDEAQAIKNPQSQIGNVVRSLKTHHKLCLTGTPMENHLGELWSLFDFLMPGFLKSLKAFKRQFRTPIEKHNDMTCQKELNKRIHPFLLRRTKAYVAAELPDKTEIIRYCDLEGKQRQLYEAVRLSMEYKVRQLIQEKGVKRSQIEILDALLKLRQACCDPRLLSIQEAQNVTQSSKLDLLMTLLPDLIEDGRKILLFSQFTSMLDLIENELAKANIAYVKLTGQTQKRDQVIEQFQNGQIPLFLISLKAGGFGLNLTAADTVIHYDPWWNPAVENQATDRTHRIGQDQKVFVYKLVASQTVEEKILNLQAKKQQIADNTYGKGNEPTTDQLTGDDLLALFKE